MYINKKQIEAIGVAMDYAVACATGTNRWKPTDYYIASEGMTAFREILDTYTKDCLRLADAQRKRRATPEGREYHNRLSRESARRRKKIVG